MTQEKNKTTSTILLVEDEFNIAKLFTYNLTKAGFHCEHANNGREGLAQALKNKPDLIISDVMMPEMDGFEFRKKLLEDESQLVKWVGEANQVLKQPSSQ